MTVHPKGSLGGVGAIPSADIQGDGTCPFTNGATDMGRLGISCLPISPPGLRLLTSNASAMIYNRLDMDSAFSHPPTPM